MKVAAVQMDVKIFETQHNLARILAMLEEAARAGAKIVAFPECALTGYCFTSREEAWPLAETVPGPSTEKLAEAAKRLDCTAIVGMLEREGAVLYNSAAVVDPGGILGTYRKMHLPCLGIDWFNALGDKPFPVFATAHGKVGVNICYDCSIPEAGRVPKLKGAQLLVIPTNWPVGSDSWAHTPKVRALENHFHVIASDRVGEERGFRFSGHSQIVDFMGTSISPPRTRTAWCACRERGSSTASRRAARRCTGRLPRHGPVKLAGFREEHLLGRPASRHHIQDRRQDVQLLALQGEHLTIHHDIHGSIEVELHGPHSAPRRQGMVHVRAIVEHVQVSQQPEATDGPPKHILDQAVGGVRIGRNHHRAAGKLAVVESQEEARATLDLPIVIEAVGEGAPVKWHQAREDSKEISHMTPTLELAIGKRGGVRGKAHAEEIDKVNHSLAVSHAQHIARARPAFEQRLGGELHRALGREVAQEGISRAKGKHGERGALTALVFGAGE
jgi:predicted amidohydrolase